MSDTTFIVRLDEPGDGPRLAIKDIDVAGIPTNGRQPCRRRSGNAGRA